MGKQYHSEFSGGLGSLLTGYSQQMLHNLSQQRRFTKLFLPFYRIYHYPIYWLLLDQENPYAGKKCWG
jgi:hypothetical protein